MILYNSLMFTNLAKKYYIHHLNYNVLYYVFLVIYQYNIIYFTSIYVTLFCFICQIHDHSSEMYSCI